MDISILIFTGVACGLFTSLFGWGGGITIVPALLIYFPLEGINKVMTVHLALGTCFLVMFINNLFSTYKSHKSGFVIWEVFFLLVPLTVIGMILGGFLEKIIPADVNIIILIVVVIYALIKFMMKVIAYKKEANETDELNIKKKRLVSFGLLVGIFSSCTGGGSSLMLSPVLKNTNMKMKEMIAVITAMNMLIATMGVIVFIFIGFS